MKKTWYVAVCILFFTIGCFFFFYQESCIIIHIPTNTSKQLIQQHNTFNHKSVTLFYKKHNKEHKETTDIIFSNNIAQNIKQLINAWLMFVDDEHITNQDTQVISVAISPSGQEALICLNQHPFEKSWSIYQKWMWVESLLKTIKENKIPILSIRLLVHHQPLQDDHLNFDISWPLFGFCPIS